MWLCIIFLITSAVGANVNGKEFHELNTNADTTSGVIDSFNKFQTDVTTFFKINYDRIEQKRRKIKSAFLEFFNAVFHDDSKHSECPRTDIESITENYRRNNEDQENQLYGLVKWHGFSAEIHTVATTDGYFLTLHRILPDTQNSSFTKSQVVLMHHGIFGSAEDWLLLGPKKALPYILLNSDYDVWLTNARGSKYSTEYDTTPLSDDEYWNFSWHEMGQYDLPAVIDYIKERYENKIDLHFIGHSMGCSALLVLLSIYPQYNYVLKSAVLLAPMAYMYKIKGPLRLLAEFYHQNEIFRKYETLNFLKADKSAPLQSLPFNVVDKYCHGDKTLCKNPLLLISNGGQEIPNANLREAVLFRTPSGISVKTIIHYLQLVKSGNFQMYDMGSIRNLKKYGKAYPPIYRLNDVTLPVAVFSSTDDWLSTIPDIQSLLPNLQNLLVHHIVRRDEFSHTDFVWAEDADVLVYYLIIDLLKDLKSSTKYQR